jgi:hypothetical protein
LFPAPWRFFSGFHQNTLDQAGNTP